MNKVGKFISSAAKDAVKTACKNLIANALTVGILYVMKHFVWKPLMRKINKLSRSIGEEPRYDIDFEF